MMMGSEDELNIDFKFCFNTILILELSKDSASTQYLELSKISTLYLYKARKKDPSVIAIPLYIEFELLSVLTQFLNCFLGIF